MQDLYNGLKCYTAKEYKSYIEITIPVVLFTCGSMLKLRIKHIDDGFKIYCPIDMFADANNTQSYYFKLFEKNDKNYHYDITIKNEIIYKNYPEDRSVWTAVDEFVRFYIMLDNFIINNDVIGHESDFE